MTDERLGEVLRGAIPAVSAVQAAPDVWDSIVSRFDRSPRPSVLDLGLAAAVVALLLMNPEWIWLLVYHL